MRKSLTGGPDKDSALAPTSLNTYAKQGTARDAMGAREFDERLRDAGICLPEEEFRAALAGAEWLLELANHLKDEDPIDDRSA
jgi:hypothetical protein